MNPIKWLACWILREDIETMENIHAIEETYWQAENKDLRDKFESYLRKKARNPKERIKK